MHAPRCLVHAAAILLVVSLVVVSAAPVHGAGGALSNCTVPAAQLPLDAEEQAVLNQTNAYRVAAGVPPLAPDFALTQSALWKSSDMATQGYVAHDDPFRSWQQRMADCGYVAQTAIGENLAAGIATGSATLMQWETSLPHNANLLNPDFTAIGIKRVHATNPTDRYGWYWTMELGGVVATDLTVGLQTP